jgi:hypothetical protein
MAFSLSVSMSTRVTPVAASAASHAIKAGAGSMQKVALYMTALSWLKKGARRGEGGGRRGCRVRTARHEKDEP